MYVNPPPSSPIVIPLFPYFPIFDCAASVSRLPNALRWRPSGEQWALGVPAESVVACAGPMPPAMNLGTRYTLQEKGTHHSINALHLRSLPVSTARAPFSPFLFPRYISFSRSISNRSRCTFLSPFPDAAVSFTSSVGTHAREWSALPRTMTRSWEITLWVPNSQYHQERGLVTQ